MRAQTIVELDKLLRCGYILCVAFAGLRISNNLPVHSKAVINSAITIHFISDSVVRLSQKLFQLFIEQRSVHLSALPLFFNVCAFSL